MLVRQRVIVIAMIAWLPLLVLSALEGQMRGGSAAVPFLSGRGSTRPLSGGAAPVDHCRAGRAPAHAFTGAAIPGTQFDSRERDATVRSRHRIGVQAAQLGTRRGTADRLRIWGRHPDRLAALHRTRHGNLVRDTVRRWLETLARRNLVWLREPADLPVPVGPLVFSIVHLDALSLAGVTHRAEPGSHASGSRRRPEFSFQHGLCLRCARGCARCAARRSPCQPHILRRGRTDSISRPRSPSWSY